MRYNRFFTFLVLIFSLLQTTELSATVELAINHADLSKYFSGTGDIVGNGRLTNDDPRSYLTPSEVEKRNEQFDQILDNLNINPFSSGTGDVVGNGGGILESHAHYYYQTIERHILSSFSQTTIDFSYFERNILQKILYSLPLMANDKLRFLSGDDALALFLVAGSDKAPRVAKTGFSPSYPIYINIERLYEKIESTPKFLLGLLIHELGHQVGIADHGVLDSLASKVVQVSELNKEEIKSRLALGDLTITIHNHFYQSSPSDIFFSYASLEMETLKWDMDSLRKVCGTGYVYSAIVSNLHWSNRKVDLMNGAYLEAKGWLDIECMSSLTGMITQRKRNLEVSIELIDNKIKTEMSFTK